MVQQTVLIDPLQFAQLTSAVQQGSSSANDGIGAQADVAVTDPALDGSLVALTKGELTLLGKKADAAVDDPTAAGNVIQWLKGLVKGLGKTADAAVTSFLANGSLVALTKGLLSYAAASQIGGVFWTEAITAQAGGATFNGAARDAGASSGNAVRVAKFSAALNADQNATLLIHSAPAAGGPWTAMASVATLANQPAVLSAPITDQFHRASVLNGGAANVATPVLKTAYTGA